MIRNIGRRKKGAPPLSIGPSRRWGNIAAGGITALLSGIGGYTGTDAVLDSQAQKLRQLAAEIEKNKGKQK